MDDEWWQEGWTEEVRRGGSDIKQPLKKGPCSTQPQSVPAMKVDLVFGSLRRRRRLGEVMWGEVRVDGCFGNFHAGCHATSAGYTQIAVYGLVGWWSVRYTHTSFFTYDHSNLILILLFVGYGECIGGVQASSIPLTCHHDSKHITALIGMFFCAGRLIGQLGIYRGIGWLISYYVID